MQYSIRLRLYAQAAFALGIFALGTTDSLAQKSWNSAIDGNWNVGSNWTPPGVPGTSDNVTIGDVVGTEGTRVTLDVSDTVGTLTMLNGNDFDTASFEFVADSATLSGSGTTLLVKPNNGGASDSFDVDFMDVNSGALVQMLGGRIEIDANSGDGRFDLLGTLTGYGFIDLETPAAGSRFTLSGGTLNVGSTSDGIIIIIGDAAQTLEINATDPGATVDFDNGISPTVNLLPAGTLDLNVPMNDTYNATMNLSRKSTLDIEDAWEFAGTMNVNTQAGFFVGQSAGPATLRGGGITMSGGEINLDNVADHLIVDLAGGQFTTTGGTINFTQGKLQFDSPGNIGSATDFANGTDNTELILNATLTVNDDDWDWDGDGGLDNIITINDFGQLNANITNASADDAWSGVMNINGGNLNVNADNNNWTNAAVINIGGTNLSRILGDTFEQNISVAAVNVAAGADLDFSSTNIWTNGNFVVDGDVDLNGATTWAGTSVSGTGVLQQDSDATVTANTTIGVATYDLDGNSGGNTDITINPGVTFTVDSTAIDTAGGFGGNLHVNSATLDVNTANWEIDNGGDLNLNNTSTLDAGGTLTVQSGGNISAVGIGNAIHTDVIFEEGSNLNVNSGGSLSFGNGGHTTTLAGGNVIQDVGGATVSNNGTLRVTGTSTVSVTNFDWDQGSTVIESTGNLSLNVTNIDVAAPVNQYDNSLTINGGSLSVDNAANVWLMDSTTNFNNGGTIIGDAVRFGDDTGASDSNLNVNGTGVAVLGSTSTTFLSDADVFIGAGATLRNTTTTNFEPDSAGVSGEFTGTGTWQLGGANNFNEVTTINMTGGTVDLDNSFSLLTLFTNDTAVNANLTINAATMASYGNRGEFLGISNFSDMNIADAATLTVNLDNPSDEWTVNANGRINYSGNSSVNTFLAGSDINMDGIMTVNGDGRSTARLDIGGTININGVGVDEGFRLGGGGVADPNTLAGGTINGPGPLRADNNRLLTGFGTINADVVFSSSADLLADGGTLNVNTITSVGRLGTANPSGVLNVVPAWNTNAANEVVLKGGELRGGTITNDLPSGIAGRGLITSPIINNTRIRANGGSLTVNNAANDWDGATNSGALLATSGDLTLLDNAAFPFQGTVQADAGHTVFANGFELEFDPGSTLQLNGGTYRSTNATDFAGAINATAGVSTIQIAGTAVLESPSTTTVTGDLVVDNANTRVHAGATFSGGGTLVNPAGSQLTLLDGAAVNVLVENQGTLVLGSSPGQTTGLDFEQSSTGIWQVELGGTGLNDYDRMSLTGTAQLAGELEVSLLGAFNPALNDTFTILSAPGSVLGTFSFEDFSGAPLDSGLTWDIIYNPTNVQLAVIAAPAFTADFDMDGDVDDDDLAVWQGAYGAGNGADANGDGMSDGADFLAWQQQFGSGVPLPAAQAVPEPATVALLALAMLLVPRRR